ncbi:MAG: hypothetical protein A4E25_00961 [Methanobacterium sp. PtaB.Bin024]|nr:MAG: hypothetical protein A4E25_00961 [Methanobacterium sp. PtaB.Bin024]
MDIGEIISDSIKYPSSDWGKVLMLGVIFIASILIIPIFLAMGYVFRIIKSTLVGIDELPEFDEIGDMFIDGLKIFVVGIVYSIPIWIIYGIIFVLGLGMITAYGDAVTSSTAFGLMAVIYIVLIIVAFIVGLFELMAIANMAYYNGDLEAAFRFREILEHISNIGWGKYIVTMIVIGIISGIGYLIGWLTMFIFIGFILLPLIIMPYIMMFVYRAIALLLKPSFEGKVIE